VAKHVSPITHDDHTIISSDGESPLFIRQWRKGSPRLHFLITHGALEHSGRHDDLVQYWLKTFNNVSVTVFDLVGHGKSGGTRAYVPKFKVYVDDLLKIGAYIQEKNLPETQTFICAHSLGGLITLTRLLDPGFGWSFPLKGVIFSSPCIRPKSAIGTRTESILGKLDNLTPKLHLPMIYGGTDLTSDAERANDFDADSMIPKFITVRMAKEIFEASQRVRGLSYYLKIPSLFLIAGDDRIVDAESSTLFAHGIDKRLTSIVQYPNSRHELWNEADRFEVFETMKKWVDRQMKESP
jgi:alpha-beta hydrolase superfamily lysophospholipase